MSTDERFTIEEFVDAFGNTHVTIDPGDVVLCDACSADFTESAESGGILFGGKAICPRCAPDWERNAVQYDEQQHIKARCPEGKSFGAWVREDLR